MHYPYDNDDAFVNTLHTGWPRGTSTRVFFTLKAEEEEEVGLWYTIIINHQQP